MHWATPASSPPKFNGTSFYRSDFSTFSHRQKNVFLWIQNIQNLSMVSVSLSYPLLHPTTQLYTSSPLTCRSPCPPPQMIAPGAAGPARPPGTTGAAPDRRRGQSVPCEGHHSFGVREWPSPLNEHPPHPQTSAFESQGKSYVENFECISNLIMSPIMPPPPIIP